MQEEIKCANCIVQKPKTFYRQSGRESESQRKYKLGDSGGGN